MDHVQASHYVELLHWRGQRQAQQTALTFLADGEREETTWTYEVLDRRARAVAGALLEQAQPGDRALLLCPAGLDFVAAFLGCLYAGLVAVPAYPPRNARHMPRVYAILDDASAAIILTTSKVQQRIVTWLSADDQARHVSVLCVDQLQDALADTWTPPDLSPDSLSFFAIYLGLERQSEGRYGHPWQPDGQ